MTSPVSSSGDLTPAGPRRQQRGVQLPQLLLSLLVVAVFALLAVWWQASTTSRTPVLVLANDVPVGVPLVRSDLTEVYVSSDVKLEVAASEFAAEFVGALPVADFSAGTFVTDEMFRLGSPVLRGQGVVGLILDGSRSPSGLKSGDRVQVLDEGSDGVVEMLSPDARVEVVRSDGQNSVVRLRLEVTAAQRVQLNSDTVVLIKVDNSGPASWEDPS